METSTWPRLHCEVIALLVVTLSAAAVVSAQDCANIPAFPSSITTTTQDRDRLMCIQGLTYPTLPPRIEDPDAPSNGFPRAASSPEGNCTDPRGHTVVRTAWGQWQAQRRSAALPQSIGNIAPNGSNTTIINFPASAGSPGNTVVERYTGNYTGGTFAGSIRAVLP